MRLMVAIALILMPAIPGLRNKTIGARWTLLTATVSVVLAIASSGRGAEVYLVVDEANSWLNQRREVSGEGVPIRNTFPQESGVSYSTHFFGDMKVDVEDNSIQLLPGASISAAVTGDYAPHDYVYQAPYWSGFETGFGVTPNANYGLALVGLGWIVQYNLRIDNGAAALGFPSTPMPILGGQFDLAGQAMSFTDGREAWSLGISDSLVGQPFIFFGRNDNDIGTWDGTTLTLPVHSSFSRTINTEEHLNEVINVTGQLVLVKAVPEPPTLTLLSVSFALVVIGRRRIAGHHRDTACP